MPACATCIGGHYLSRAALPRRSRRHSAPTIRAQCAACPRVPPAPALDANANVDPLVASRAPRYHHPLPRNRQILVWVGRPARTCVALFCTCDSTLDLAHSGCVVLVRQYPASAGWWARQSPQWLRLRRLRRRGLEFPSRWSLHGYAYKPVNHRGRWCVPRIGKNPKHPVIWQLSNEAARLVH